tara:strand:- start:1029 stop:1205 length:177 start_codon:yes stop_codon:yes gene_type:complete
MTIFNDEKIWKEHYKDWLNVLDHMGFNGDDSTKPEQYDYRVKVIKSLISNYEDSDHAT